MNRPVGMFESESSDCERCQGKTREQLCNELGHYVVAIETIRHHLEEKTYTLELFFQAIETLDECLETEAT